MPPRRGVGRRWVERIAMLFLLSLAWIWIFSVGALFIHTIRSPPKKLGSKMMDHIQGDSDMTGTDPEQEQQVQRAQEEHGSSYDSPLVIFTCRRANYLRETMTQVLEYLPSSCETGCPVIVSQDGYDKEVTKVVRSFQENERKIPVVHLQHEPYKTNLRGPTNAYKALAVHYGWALQKIFSGISPYDKPDRLIILEEDLRISPDFFDYFHRLAPILDHDHSLLAVSAFNDNGKEGNIKDSKRVVRSDFFPGLGWMMTRKLWDEELSAKWPDGYWDDWLREAAQRKGRHILRPEISRTFHFGTQGGASGNQFGTVLSTIHLNDDKVDWTSVDLTHLEQLTFDQDYFDLVSAATQETDVHSAIEKARTEDVRVEYSNFEDFRYFALVLHIMADEKAGVPRTAYKGVVEFRPHGDHFLFLMPHLKKLQKDFNVAR